MIKSKEQVNPNEASEADLNQDKKNSKWPPILKKHRPKSLKNVERSHFIY